ncbi:DinB family protein [Paenibacillus sp. MBLB4367]|uniref:DinB family protein n=1 Tax=Paenibacillus sp. MBLB4367 TaxID=3384767 RepID=UPI003908098A
MRCRVTHCSASLSKGGFLNYLYNQEAWVSVQYYKEAPIEDVLELWVSLNRSVLRVIGSLPETSLARSCQLPDGSLVTLGWLIDDYLVHMKHHLRQIFNE